MSHWSIGILGGNYFNWLCSVVVGFGYTLVTNTPSFVYLHCTTDSLNCCPLAVFSVVHEWPFTLLGCTLVLDFNPLQNERLFPITFSGYSSSRLPHPFQHQGVLRLYTGRCNSSSMTLILVFIWPTPVIYPSFLFLTTFYLVLLFRSCRILVLW